MNIKELNSNKTVVFGDPCYMFCGDAGYQDWLKFCNKLQEMEAVKEQPTYKVEFFSKKADKVITVWCASTKHGDGGYYGRKTGNLYGVDSGLLGALSLEDALLVGADEGDGKTSSKMIDNGLSNVFPVEKIQNVVLEVKEENHTIVLKDLFLTLEEVPTDEEMEEEDWGYEDDSGYDCDSD